MNKKLYIAALFASLFMTVVFGQKGVIKSAQKEYDKLSYIKTTEQLLELAEAGNTSVEVLQNLANAYYYNGKMEAASKWYSELINLNNENEAIDKESYFRYALALKALEEYDKSNKIMNKFSEQSPNDSRSILFKENQNYFSKIETLSDDFELQNLDINTPFSDFGTSTYLGNLIFASSKDINEDLYTWNEQPFLDLFQLQKDSGEVSKLEGAINTRYHESSTAFTKDGKTMYFTRNNYFEGKLKNDRKNTHKLKIYKASLIDGEWTNIESLPFNNDEYSVAHPALSSDETMLYFASDMPGTIGESDIFVVTINEDSTYGEPTNLGGKINTEGRENFPFICEKGHLYFSSDGHIGLGGLDVFKFEDSIVHNLGKPINSSKDDFGYIINESTQKGYISSNRVGGVGDDDIYSFTKNICTQNVTGMVVNQDTNETIANADVKIYNSNKEVIKTLKSDVDGNFNFELACEDKSYNAIGSKATYTEASESFNISSKNKETVMLKLALKQEPQAAAVGTDLLELLNLEPIFFDFDKSFIRPDAEIELTKIISYLKAFPTVKVDVRSHTDSRGGDTYNFALSNRRNKSTQEYIINVGGIASDRLTGKGYGKTKLTNKCVNGVKCTKDEHQDNRRSEFIVVAN